MTFRVFTIRWIAMAGLIVSTPSVALPADPPAIDPFEKTPLEREDAFPGYVELSDGSIHPGRIYLTRGVRLKTYDEKTQKQGEVAWESVKEIECKVKREWMEKEWRFKESAGDEKIYTGRSYPAREYVYTIRLRDGRTISSPLSAIVYLEPRPKSAAAAGQKDKPEPERHLLHKRDKGKLGEELQSLVYVKRIKLGKEAFEEGQKKAEKGKSNGR